MEMSTPHYFPWLSVRSISYSNGTRMCNAWLIPEEDRSLTVMMSKYHNNWCHALVESRKRSIASPAGYLECYGYKLDVWMFPDIRP